MKIILLIASLFLTITLSFGQHIPDANFASAIRENCSGCLDINNNLTQVATTVHSLDVPYKNIKSLEGINGFLQLWYLNCSTNQLTSIPTLPNSLTTLLCSNNQLSSLSSLPSSLVSLDCSNNQLISLPTLPNSLTTLLCGNNQLASLPPLPILLVDLNCNYNQINSLPVLPSSLGYLVCNNNSIVSLPILPTNLVVLECDHNLLSELPNLPNLTDLICNDNKLTTLPKLPNTLLRLYCDSNQLTFLPLLPNSLGWLICHSNQIATLPALPINLLGLSCYQNLFLSCLPKLPITLKELSVSNNITCIPNGVVGLNIKVYQSNNTIIATTLPICTTPCNDNETLTIKFSYKDVNLVPPYFSPINYEWNPNSLITEKDFGEQVKVAADGEIGTVIEVTNSNTSRNIELAIRIVGSNDTTILGKLIKINATTYEYRNPKKMVMPSNKVKVDIKATVGSQVFILGTFDLTPVPPPVLLVHGLNSSGATWTELKKYLLANNYLPSPLIATPDLPKDQAFDPTYTKVGDKIDNLLFTARSSGVAANKVDIIGHSMGGILSRLYLQNYGNKKINKLITLNTPHSGSPLANYLQDPSLGGSILNVFGSVSSSFFSAIPKPNSGAIIDLQIGSNAIDNLLNGTALNASVVPCHAIHTTASLAAVNVGCTLLPGVVSKIPIVGNFVSVPLRLICIGARPILNESIFKDANGNSDTHDWVVTTQSQKGGLTGTTVSFIDHVIHTEATSNDAVKQKALELLRADSKSPKFAQTGFHPVRLRYISPPIVVPTENTATVVASLKIDPSVKGKKYKKGDILTINVTASSDVQKVALMSTTDKSDSLTFVYLDTAPFAFSYQVPNDFNDTIKLLVLAQPNVNTVVSDSSYIVVKTERPFPTGLSTCLEDDFRQLELLYDDTNGDSWTNKTNWFTNSNLTTWYGIILTPSSCDVQSINMSGNNLVGTLPKLSFPELLRFQGWGNKLSGELPNFIMPKLTDFNFQDQNTKGGGFTGAIPNFDMPNLKTLHLWGNKFLGTIPDFNMPLLEQLLLSSNQLGGSIPDFKMPNLLSLDLGNNFLTGTVPNFNMPKLLKLAFGFNRLTGTIPNFNMPLLQELWVQNCQFTGSIPNFNMPNLAYLDLGGNLLTSSVPNFNMPKLIKLAFGYNLLTGNIPNFNMPVLRELWAQNCQFTGNIPNFNTPLLTTFNFGNNKFIFGNITSKTWLSTATLVYAPQAKIPMTFSSGKLSISTGELDNVQQFQWYRNGVLIATTQSSQYQPTTTGTYYCKATHNTLTVASNANKNLILQSEDYSLSVLPVELLTFTAHPLSKTVQLNWQTASEKNASHFVVARSSDGKTFYTIGQVKAQGNSTALLSYTFTDGTPLNGVNYYRLRQLDRDGKEMLSNIVSVTMKIEHKLKMYPNPVSTYLSIETESTGIFQILNLLGQEVKRGKVTNRIDVSTLPEGAYILKIGSEQARFVKQ
jgi:Leucine-rich repeat (LRR) protein/pimeloyl-ACP methyl ester carboxylesterase